MSISVKVSQLGVLSTITGDDYFVLNDSGSVTTKRTPIDAFIAYITGSDLTIRSSSYAISSSRSSLSTSASYSLTSSFAISCSLSSQSLDSFNSWQVIPPTSVASVNLVGTSSWSQTALSVIAGASISVTSSLAKTASFLNYTGIYNGSASCAVTASYSLLAQSAVSFAGGSAVSGEGTKNYIVKWSGSSTPSTIVTESYIYDDCGNKTIFMNNANCDPNTISNCWVQWAAQGYTEKPFIFAGGNIYITGSGTCTPRGTSPKICFYNYESSDYAMMYMSSSLVGSSYDNGAFVFQTGDNALEPFIFKSNRGDTGLIKELLRIQGTWDSRGYVRTTNAALYVDDYIHIGQLETYPYSDWSTLADIVSLRVSASFTQNHSVIIENPIYWGIEVNKYGQVGIGKTVPQTRVDVTGSVGANSYFLKHGNGSDYVEGIDGNYLVYSKDDPNGTYQMIELVFRKGILVGTSTRTKPIPNAPITPTDPTWGTYASIRTTADYGGGGPKGAAL